MPASGSEDYIVTVAPPAGYTTTPTNNSGSTSYTLTHLASGQILDTADWGFVDDGTPSASGRIGDRVYSDLNGNGIDDGEPGLTGVTLKLMEAGGDGVLGTADDVEIASTITSSTGAYQFIGVPVGDYRVIVTDVNAVTTGMTETQTAPGSISITCDMTGCTDFVLADFGFIESTIATGSIGDLVWFDVNGDGLQAGEGGISGVTVDLIDCGTGTCSDGDERVAATRTTDSNGAYDFSGLAAGEYTVVVTDNNQVLGGLLPSNTPTLPVTISCTSGTGGSCTDHDTADFGYKPTAGNGVSTLGGTLWRDAIQGNATTETGVLNTGEPGIQGVSVELWLDDGDGLIEPGTDNLVRTTLTDANGNYQFLGLPPGAYIVNVTDTSGVLGGMTSVQGPSYPYAPQTGDNEGHCADGATACQFATTIPANSTDTSVDFAYQADPLANEYSISGTLFEDSGGSGTLGVKDAADIDPRASGATVTLYRVVNGQSYAIGTTTTTPPPPTAATASPASRRATTGLKSTPPVR